jgi:hypothetical protein
MALVTERVATAVSGQIWVDVTFNNTGQFLVDRFDVHNETGKPCRVQIQLAADNSVLFEDWYGGGSELNPRNPNIDTQVPVTQSLSWRRATKSTNWRYRISWPNYPPPA